MIRSIAVRGHRSPFGSAAAIAPLTAVLAPDRAERSGLQEAIGFLGATARGDLRAAFGDAGEDPWFAFADRDAPIRIEAEVELSATSVHADAGQPGQPAAAEGRVLRYALEIGLRSGSGALAAVSETLRAADGGGEFAAVRGGRIAMPSERRGAPDAHPEPERTAVASLAYEPHHPHLAAFRRELASWRTHRTIPGGARSALPITGIVRPAHGGHGLAAFLYRLRVEHPRRFGELNAMLRALIPGAEEAGVHAGGDGLLRLHLREGGVRFSHELISDGAIRVIALLAALVAPDDASVVCVADPETGVYGPRLEEVAGLLAETARGGRQCIVTTRSPRLADMLARMGALVLAHSRGGDAEPIGAAHRGDGAQTAP